MIGRDGGGRLGIRVLLVCTRFLNVTVLAIMLLVATVVCALSLLTVTGYLRVQDELTGSMAPAIKVGDLIVYRPTTAARLRRGDIISYVRADDRISITHRVRSISRDGGAIDVATRGDANPVNDRGPAVFDARQRIWRVRVVVPRIGFALAAVTGGHGLPLMLGLVPLYLMLPWVGRQLAAELQPAGVPDSDADHADPADGPAADGPAPENPAAEDATAEDAAFDNELGVAQAAGEPSPEPQVQQPAGEAPATTPRGLDLASELLGRQAGSPEQAEHARS